MPLLICQKNRLFALKYHVTCHLLNKITLNWLVGTLSGDDTVTCDNSGQWQLPDVTCILDTVTPLKSVRLQLWPPGVAENEARGTDIGALTLFEGNTTVDIKSCKIVGDSRFSVLKNVVEDKWKVKVQG